MPGTINYTLTHGVLPITVSISPSVAPDNLHSAYGSYSFVNIPSGTYTISFIDSGTCQVDLPVTITGATPSITPSLSPRVSRSVTPTITTTPTPTSSSFPASALYVSTDGSDTIGNGTINNPFRSINQAWENVLPGGTIYLRDGIYSFSEQQRLTGKNGTSGNPITISAYPGETPYLGKLGGSFSWTNFRSLIYLEGNYINLKSLKIFGNYQEDTYVWMGIYLNNFNNCVFDELDIYGNGLGAYATGNADGNLFLNCDFHDNYDPITNYENSDGLNFENIPEGGTNTIRGCRFWQNGDDGLDLYGNDSYTIVENCWAWTNGFQEDGIAMGGDGNGFKLGGPSFWGNTNPNIAVRITNCLSYGNTAWGYNENASPHNMEAYNNISYDNNRSNGWGGGFHFNKATIPYYIKNNIAFGESTEFDSDVTTNVDHNSWNLSVTVAANDFKGVDGWWLISPRSSDGNLPVLDFLHLETGSDLIHSGVTINGLTTDGDRQLWNSPPSLGAFEHSLTPAPLPSPSLTPTRTITPSRTPSTTPLGLIVGAFYVSPSGSDINPGTLALPWRTLQYAFNQLTPGQTLYMRGGTYAPTATLTNSTYCGVSVNSKNGSISSLYTVLNFPNEYPVLDGVNMTGGSYTKTGVYLHNSSYWHIKGLEIKNMTQDPTTARRGAGLWLNSSHHNTIERCVSHHNGGPGFQVRTSTGNDNHFINCDAYYNYDAYSSLPGDDADGWDIGYGSINGNEYIVRLTGCRSWDNSDDGFDCFQGSGYRTIHYFTNCWAWRNGYIPGTNTQAGQGCGFKLGNDDQTYDGITKRYLYNCVAYNNRARGFSQESARVKKEFYNCIAYNNRTWGFSFGWLGNSSAMEVGDILRNCVAFNNDDGNVENLHGGTFYATRNSASNTWDSGMPSATTSDFASIDGSLLLNARNPSNGQLPVISFLHLSASSDLRYASTDSIGLSTDGDGYPWASPDRSLGAFEYSVVPQSVTPSITPTKTLSKTPSITPSRSPQSPSVTPTITLTPTPTRTLSRTPSRSNPISGTIYYVKDTGLDIATNGSFASPWKTLHYAATRASSPSTIYIIGTIYESVQTSLPTGINITGDGSTSIISSTYSSSHTIVLGSKSTGLNVNGNQTISNIKMNGNTHTALSAIGILNRGNVLISNCELIDFNYYGVFLENGANDVSPPATFASNNRIIDCIITNCARYTGTYGVSGADSKGSIDVCGQEGLIISGNTIVNNRNIAYGYDGNCIDGVEGHVKNMKVHHNILYKTFYPSHNWDFAIEIWNWWEGNEIYENEINGSVDIVRAHGKGASQYCVWVHDNVIGQGALMESEHTHGVLSEAFTNDIIIEKNFIKNVAIGISTNTDYGPPNKPDSDIINFRISYNILHNIGVADSFPTGSKGWGIHWQCDGCNFVDTNTTTNVEIYNNVLVGNYGARTTMWGIQVPSSAQATNIFIKNNIIMNFDYAGIYNIQSSGAPATIDNLEITNNIVYGCGNGNDYRWVNGIYATNTTIDPTIKSNPSFVSVNVNTPNYHLSAGSTAAINAGTPVSPVLLTMTTDYDGITIGNPPEIGAYEYGVAASPSVTRTTTPTPTPTKSPAPASPSITPTPTVTRTPNESRPPSRTPSMTPTITPSRTAPSRTPSMTPSRTPSTSSGSNPIVIVEGLNRTCTTTTNSACYSYTEVPINAPTNFTFRNNSITSVNQEGYIARLGDDGTSSSNNRLDGEIVSGNKLTYNGISIAGTSIITHGLIVGFNINTVVKYNYLLNAPYGIIYKSGGSLCTYMTNTSGGASYNIVKNGRFAGRVKGIHGCKYINNTFYSGDGNNYYRLLISPNGDYACTETVGSINTKVFNNIFYGETSIVMIKIYNNCRTGFESDYNIFYCATGSPTFQIAADNGSTTTYSFAQWQALGYDAHSVITNPNFIDKINFVPTYRLDYGTNLGAEFDTGLSTTAVWTVGVSPTTQVQNGAWQVGARIHAQPSGYRYVSPSGFDTNNGTFASPWATLSYACTNTTNVGSTIYVYNGTYTEYARCNLSSGVSILGESEAGAIINFRYAVNDFDSGCIRLYNSSLNNSANQSISNLTITGSNFIAYNAISLFYRGGVSIHHCTIKNFYSNGIVLGGDDSILTIPAVGNTIYNCTITDCSKRQSGLGYGSIMIRGQKDLSIHDNILSNMLRTAGDNGNLVNAVRGGYEAMLFYNNICTKPNYDNGEWNFHMEIWATRGGNQVYDNQFIGGECAIDISSPENTSLGHYKTVYDYSWYIHDNVFDNVIKQSAPETNNNRFCITIEDCNVNDVWMTRNHFIKQPTPIVISMGTNDNGPYTNLHFYYNVFEDVGYTSQSAVNACCLYVKSFGSNAVYENVTFQNNTVVGGSPGKPRAIVLFYFAGTVNGMNISNNIMINANTAWLVTSNNGTKGTINSLVVRNNILYNNANNNALSDATGMIAGATYVTSGNILNDNPDFVSSTDFHLTALSPAINAGYDLNLEYDYDGVAVNTTTPEIGAYEFI